MSDGRRFGSRNEELDFEHDRLTVIGSPTSAKPGQNVWHPRMCHTG
jgi:hypothetical protein